MANKLRVVHFIAGPYLKSDWIYNLIKNHQRYEPIIYCFRKRNLEIFPFDPVFSFEKFGKYSPGIWWRLGKDRPALIHAHFGNAGYDILAQKMLFNIPLVTSFYGADISTLPKTSLLWRYRYQLLFKFGDRFLTTGRHMRRSAINAGCPPEKAKVFPIGIDLGGIPYKTRTLTKSGEVRILYAGRLAQKKGVPDLVDAFSLLLNALPDKKIRLTIAAAVDNSLEQQKEKRLVLAKINDYHLQPHVTLDWARKSYPDYIAQLYKHHLFVSPSVTADNGDDEGGYLLSSLEASASGMPIISTQHCDIPDTVADGKSGYLVPEHRPDLLAKKMTSLCLNPQNWAIIGQTGRDLVEKKFNDKKQIVRLEKIYDSLIL